ncbi:hypothetical protein [Neobacillus niacini]|uniref:hypothetical protein n=1 Tax=Neobacillus niacini TaxID=86668 RepID=UPI00285CAFE4|nr:hypothetical protein [Neobacillus niacini]MDR7000499.1 uncharacterized protein YxjI [Neobacillus niacini]
MNKNSLYFKDNFFSSGRTEVFNSLKEKVGELDLNSAFSSSIDVIEGDGKKIISGRFGFFSNKWRISDGSGQEIGILKQKLTFLAKKYEYNAYTRGIYTIEAEVFSRQYEVLDEQSNQVAKFEKVNGFFASPSYQLTNIDEKLSSAELIAVVMGVNAIQKRRKNNGAAAGSAGN